MGGKSGGSKKSVVGFRYYIGLHFGICHGPIAALHSIWWADKKVWEGTVKNAHDGKQGFAAINNTSIFGGDMSEGGAGGPVEVGFGGWDQRCAGVSSTGGYSVDGIINWLASIPPINNQHWADRLKLPYRPNMKVPATGLNYRGIAVAMMHDSYIGNNAYLKDASFEVSCYWDDWQPTLCAIGDDMNPAHIIRESLVNTEWGLGYDPSTVDDVAYTAAAKTLFDEKFGLSFVWDDDQDIYSFIDSVKTCINAATFLDPKTGLWTIKLIRAGEPSAMTISPKNARLTSITRKTLGDTQNEMSTKFTNPVNEEYESVTVQDPANIEAQGRVVPASKEYVGVRSAALATRLAERDLQVASSPLWAAEMVLNREAWMLTPGMNVTLNWPRYKAENLVMRVNEVSIAAVGDDSITVSMVEDVFSRETATFSGPEESGWVDPAQPPTLFPFRHTWEYPFWFLVQSINLPIDLLPTLAGYSTEIATGGNSNAQSVYLYSYLNAVSGPAWQLVAIGALTPKTAILKDLDPALTSIIDLDVEASYRIAEAETNAFVLLTDGTHEEIVQITAFSESPLQITVLRGLMDTHPRRWPSGTVAFVIGTTTFPVDNTTRSFGEVAQYRSAMQTSIGLMDIDAIPTREITLKGRYELPYSVANVAIEGSRWPSAVEVDGEFMTVTWANRNRLLQDAAIQVPWGAAGIVPEEGTTVGVELWRGGVRKYAKAGVTGSVLAIPANQMTSGEYELRIYTERDGRRNFSDYTHTFTASVTLRGYGQNYGNSYGMSY